MLSRTNEKRVKPQTGTKVDSAMTSLLEKLSKSDSQGNLPEMPEPIFDQYLTKGKRKPKAY